MNPYHPPADQDDHDRSRADQSSPNLRQIVVSLLMYGPLIAFILFGIAAQLVSVFTIQFAN